MLFVGNDSRDDCFLSVAGLTRKHLLSAMLQPSDWLKNRTVSRETNWKYHSSHAVLLYKLHILICFADKKLENGMLCTNFMWNKISTVLQRKPQQPGNIQKKKTKKTKTSSVVFFYGLYVGGLR